MQENPYHPPDEEIIPPDKAESDSQQPLPTNAAELLRLAEHRNRISPAIYWVSNLWILICYFSPIWLYFLGVFHRAVRYNPSPSFHGDFLLEVFLCSLLFCLLISSVWVWFVTGLPDGSQRGVFALLFGFLFFPLALLAGLGQYRYATKELEENGIATGLFYVDTGEIQIRLSQGASTITA